MVSWILVLFVYAGPLAKGDSNSLTTVPGFTSSGECEEAGQFARKLAKGTIKEVSFVCLKQTKPH